MGSDESNDPNENETLWEGMAKRSSDEGYLLSQGEREMKEAGGRERERDSKGKKKIEFWMSMKKMAKCGSEVIWSFSCTIPCGDDNCLWISSCCLHGHVRAVRTQKKERRGEGVSVCVPIYIYI